jgi:hypothetical protein
MVHVKDVWNHDFQLMYKDKDWMARHEVQYDDHGDLKETQSSYSGPSQ